jgi:hypothetical protein
VAEMSDSPLHYESRTDVPRRHRSPLLTVIAALSLLTGLTLGYLFIVGFGLGDTWVIYLPHLPAYWWALPAGLIAWPAWYFGRSVAA